MKWGAYSVCSECGVHFEPVRSQDARWGTLCAIHRAPVKERDLKKDAVLAWASANWERLANMMEKECKEQEEIISKSLEAYGASCQNQGSVVGGIQMLAGDVGGLGNIFVCNMPKRP